MAEKSGGGERGRDARTGRFIPVKETTRRPSTTVKEAIKPKPSTKKGK